MKFIISLSLISLSFLATANTTEVVDLTKKSTVEAALYPGPGKKKARKNKRINKKRKRACGKWGRKSYAG